LENLLQELKTFKPNSVKIASFLFKPKAFMKNYKVDYVGLEIPNDFILGYGLDYNQAGRNLKDIYKIID
jgi:hypoxanthine phosphoribosyltransferase